MTIEMSMKAKVQVRRGMSSCGYEVKSDDQGVRDRLHDSYIRGHLELCVRHGVCAGECGVMS